jgi:hypothetical protein
MSDNGPFLDGFRAVAVTVTERYNEESRDWTFLDAPTAPERLEEFLELCFSASLNAEEHNPTALTVVIGNEEYFSRRGYSRFAAGVPHSWDYASFVEPIPMTPAALRKLAAGMDSEDGAVLAWRAPSGACCLYGIVRFPRGERLTLLTRRWDSFRTRSCGSQYRRQVALFLMISIGHSQN